MAERPHTRLCTACEDPFNLTAENLAWFAAHRLHLPNLCPRCRAAKRRAATENYLDPRAVVKGTPT